MTSGQVTIKLRYIRHAAKKLRPVLALFRGKNLDQAINQTAVMSQDSARYLHQALKSARSAAQAKEFKPEELAITEMYATEGPRIKRIRPNARGRANRYQKHLAHLTLSVGPNKPENKKSQTKKVTKTVTRDDSHGTKN